MGRPDVFSHGTKHSKGVCVLIHPSMRSKIDCIFNSNTGRMVLMEFNSLKLLLCNVYAPNHQSEQLNFLQELSIDKSELSMHSYSRWQLELHAHKKNIKWAVPLGSRQTIGICF